MIFREIPSRRTTEFKNIISDVKSIVEYVKLYGDKALIDLTRKFDGVEIKGVRLGPEELKWCAEALPADVKHSIDVIYDHLFNIHRATLPKDTRISLNGMVLGIGWRSVDKVGIYVPCGLRSYPSTLLMASVPAIVAGVREIYISSPPMKNGCINPGIAYGALKVGAKGVYRIGGPQAIAAMAYGTESVAKVDKIVGPGNIYVQAAKYIVQEVVDIDGIEGPTELVIVADDHADYRKIVIDMKAQAEHGKDTFIVLLTPSEEIIQSVERELADDTEHKYYLVKVKDIDEAVEIVDSLAPEHLSLYVRDAPHYLPKIRNVGAITLGTDSPSMIDYLGPNHILPTGGWARTRGALTVYSFLKPIAILYGSKNTARELLEAASTLAEYEGFTLHKESIGGCIV